MRRFSPIQSTLSRRSLFGHTIAVAATASALPKLGLAQDREVNIYNWDTYIADDTVDNFTAATGISVRYDLFASNDELFAKLREGNPGFDVIFPSNDYVERMLAADMLTKLDHSKIPNFANIDPDFTDPVFDRGREHCMPYMWGTIGIGYRSTVFAPTSWQELFESPELNGRVAAMNDTHIIRMALKYLGLSANSRERKEIMAAADALIKVKSQFKTFAPDTGQDLLISGEVDACMEWSGDILQVMAEDDELGYNLPSEGGQLWEDTMAIPKDGPNPEAAHEWINFILDAKVHAGIADFIKYACPNKAAMEFISEEDRNNPAIYPVKEALLNSEVAIYKGEEVESLYEEALTRVLAA